MTGKHDGLAAASLLTMVLAVAAMAQEPDRAAADCSQPEYQAVEFRLGSFIVTTGDGGRAGESSVESALGGCLLVEHWQGALGGHGRATIFYDRRQGLWHQHFVTDDGETLYLTGLRQGDSLVFTGANEFDMFVGVHRMTWSPLPGGRVRQFWELSTDGGVTWQVIHEAFYVPRT
jgi:hypothetical protein